MKISRQSVDKPVLVTLFTVILIILGIVGMQNIPLEEYPDINVPYIVVAIPYPGAAAEDIEQTVTVKVDERLNGTKHLKRLYSYANEGASVHVLELFEKADKTESLDDVKDKMDQVKRDLPDDIEEPTVTDIAFDNVPIIVVNVTGDAEPMVLMEIAKDIKTEIEAVPGVEEVAYYGGLEREIQVRIDPRKMEQYGLSYSLIIGALQHQNANLPGGHLQLNSFEYLVRTEGKFKSVREVGFTVVGIQDGHPVYLEEIADIEDTNKKISSFSRYDGQPSVSLVVYKQPDINTISTSDTIKNIAAKYDALMPEQLSVTTSMDKAEDVSRMVRELSSNALYGALFVLIVLMVFMGPRNALIVAVAIPFSLFVGFFLMWVAGFSLNMITMFSMILIIGLVVDGAMIVGENIYFYFEQGQGPVEASKKGIFEVGTAVISADLTTICAFFPMIFIVGIMGELMSFLPWVVIFALIGSIIIDHFTLPVITSKFMKTSKKDHEMKKLSRLVFIGNRFFQRLNKLYPPILRWALFHRKSIVVFGMLGFILALSILLSGAIKIDFFPKHNIGRFNVNFELPVGTAVEKTNEVAKEIEALIARIPEVKEYISTIGDTGMIMSDLAETSGGSGSGSEFGKILINVGTDNERKRPVAKIIAELDKQLTLLPGIKYSFFETELGPPVGEPVAIRILGDDLDELKRISQVVQAYLERIPGTRNIQNSFRENKPQVSIQVDRTMAAKYGMTVQDITVQVMAAFHGVEATEVMLSDELVDILVINKEEYRQNFEDVLDTPLSNALGNRIPLGQLAKIEITSGVASIRRYNLRRSVTVTAGVEKGVTPQDIFEAHQKLMAETPPPQGYVLEYGGEEEERARSFRSITSVMFLGLIFIFFVLTAQFNSFKQPLIVLLSIPLSIIGVVSGLLITGLTFSFMAFIGVVALIGIVVNDAIVLVDFVNQKMQKGSDLLTAILEVGPRRLRPVVLTTVTTIGGILPITLNLGGGGTIWAPLGTAIIFGLLFATVLTLIVVPAMYSLVERKAYKAALALYENRNRNFTL